MPGHYYVDFAQDTLVGDIVTPSAGNDEYQWSASSTQFGPMRIGHSGPDPTDAIATNDWPITQNSGGLALTVNQNQSASKPHAVESRTLYVVSQPPQSSLLFTLPNYETLFAEVVFDLPTANGPNPPPADLFNPDYAWGVTLALKDGDENEPTDLTTPQDSIRLKCQFFGGGLIHFHGTDYQKDPGNTDPMFDQNLVSTQSYGAYAGQPPTEFSLSMWISRRLVNGGTSLSGQGTLRWPAPWGINQFTGNLTDLAKYAQDGIVWAKAVGVSLANKTNSMPSVGIRLKRFQMGVSNLPRRATQYGESSLPSGAFTQYAGTLP